MFLTDAEKHRVIQMFFPVLKGHLPEGTDLKDYSVDALSRARRKGWSDAEIEHAAKTGKWKKPGATTGEAFG